MSTQDVAVSTAPAASTQPTDSEKKSAKEMPFAKKAIVFAGLALPFMGLVVALVKWPRANAVDIAIFIVGYLLSGFGITVGYHRLITHQAFETKPVVRYTFAFLGSLALQGPVIIWVANHIKHHAFADKPGDPHSPLDGFWHAHFGWLFQDTEAERNQYAKRLMEDPGMRLMERLYLPITLVSIFVPGLVSAAVTGSWDGFARGVFWGGLARAFFLLNFTFCINSVCHMYGERPFDTKDQSTNPGGLWGLILAIGTLGESNHNGHHAEPSSPIHGMLPGELDPSAKLIRGLQLAGVADATWPEPEDVQLLKDKLTRAKLSEQERLQRKKAKQIAAA